MGRIGPQYSKWRGLALADDKSRTLVSACDYLDALGMITEDGTAIAHDTGLTDVISASYELAALIAQNPGVVSALTTGSNIKSIGAGPAQVEFFAPVNGPPVPVLVMRLIGKYLPSADVSDGTDGGGEALGTGACPTFTARCTSCGSSGCTCEGGLDYSRSNPL
jgi:hypothetical protein